MTERTFRLVLGVLLLVMLYLEWAPLVGLYVALLLFEGITNWRVPIVVSRLRYGGAHPARPAAAPGSCRFPFEAERALRIVIAALLGVSYFVLHDALWFFPWFIGFALTMAGITGICPIAILMRRLGFSG